MIIWTMYMPRKKWRRLITYLVFCPHLDGLCNFQMERYYNCIPYLFVRPCADAYCSFFYLNCQCEHHDWRLLNCRIRILLEPLCLNIQLHLRRVILPRSYPVMVILWGRSRPSKGWLHYYEEADLEFTFHFWNYRFKINCSYKLVIIIYIYYCV